MKSNFLESLEKVLTKINLEKGGLSIALPEFSDIRVAEAGFRLIKNNIVKNVFTNCENAKDVFLTDLQNKFDSDIDFNALDIIEPTGEFDGSFLDGLQLYSKKLLSGDIHALVAGARLTTADVARAAIKKIGFEDHTNTLSSGFFLEKGERCVYFSDAGILIEPDENQLVEIGKAAISMWRRIVLNNASPKVAVLSFSSFGSAKHDSSERMGRVSERLHEMHPDIQIVGEVQFDAAWDPDVWQKKRSSSQPDNFAPADIFIFPDLNSANIGYKIAQRMGGYNAYGPILQGVKAPICDLSRGSTVDDIYATCLITLMQAKIGK